MADDWDTVIKKVDSLGTTFWIVWHALQMCIATLLLGLSGFESFWACLDDPIPQNVTACTYDWIYSGFSLLGWIFALCDLIPRIHFYRKRIYLQGENQPLLQMKVFKRRVPVYIRLFVLLCFLHILLPTKAFSIAVGASSTDDDGVTKFINGVLYFLTGSGYMLLIIGTIIILIAQQARKFSIPCFLICGLDFILTVISALFLFKVIPYFAFITTSVLASVCPFLFVPVMMCFCYTSKEQQ